MSYQPYLEMTMDSLSNILHNVSQNPTKEACNQTLDCIKRMLEQYEKATGKNVRINDYREKTSK